MAIYTIEEVAKILGVSYDKIWRLRNDVIPLKTLGARRVYGEREILKFKQKLKKEK